MLNEILFFSNERMFKKEPLFKEIIDNPQYFYDNKDRLETIVVNIDPYEYMDIVNSKKQHNITQSKLKNLRELYESQTQVDIPYLVFGERDNHSDYFGQEGYNRSYTATMIGKNYIPVSIRYREFDENIPKSIKKAINESKLLLNSFIIGYLHPNEEDRKREIKYQLSKLGKIDQVFLNKVTKNIDFGIIARSVKFEKLPTYLQFYINKYQKDYNYQKEKKMENNELIIDETRFVELFKKSEYLQGNYKGFPYEIVVGKYDNISYDYDEREFNLKVHNDIIDEKLGDFKAEISLFETKNGGYEEFNKQVFTLKKNPEIINILHPEVVDAYNKSIYHKEELEKNKENPLEKIIKHYKDNLPEVRFAIEQTTLYGGTEIAKTLNSFKEAYEELNTTYSQMDMYTTYEIILINKEDKKIEKSLYAYLLEELNSQTKEGTEVKLLNSVENPEYFNIKEFDNFKLSKVVLVDTSTNEVLKEGKTHHYGSKDSIVSEFYIGNHLKDDVSEKEKATRQKQR